MNVLSIYPFVAFQKALLSFLCRKFARALICTLSEIIIHVFIIIINIIMSIIIIIIIIIAIIVVVTIIIIIIVITKKILSVLLLLFVGLYSST